MTHERNITGLRASARQRAQATRQRAEEAINLLVREGRPVNFKTVGETARVSTAWLYQQEDLKERILHLRTQQRPRPNVAIPPREHASDTSKDAMIAALRERVKRLEEENRELRRQIEVAYGLLQPQAYPRCVSTRLIPGYDGRTLSFSPRVPCEARPAAQSGAGERLNFS